MLKEIKVFCPICNSQEIIIRTTNGAFFIDEDFIPDSILNWTHKEWKCGKCDYEAKGNNFYIAQRMMTDIEEARELIVRFICSEYNNTRDEAIQKDATLISLAYTNTTDEELEIQTYVDLCEYKVLYYLGNKLIGTDTYKSLEEMNNMFLSNLNFDDLIGYQTSVYEKRKENE